MENDKIYKKIFKINETIANEFLVALINANTSKKIKLSRDDLNLINQLYIATSENIWRGAKAEFK